MKNKKGNVTRRIVALFSGVILSGQLTTAALPLYANAAEGLPAEQISTAGLLIAEGEAGGGQAVVPTTTGTITAGYDLVITSNNAYYQKLIKTVDSLVKVQQVSNGKKYTQWLTVTPFINSSTNTNLDISINMSLYDIRNYSSEEALLKNAVFHISGTHRGKKVDRYISYCSALKTLRSQLESAKQAQIKIYCRNSKELHGDFMYTLSNNQILVWTDELGRITIRTNSKINFGNGARVLITNIKPFTRTASDQVSDVTATVTLIK